jgi:hypothetical protein
MSSTHPHYRCRYCGYDFPAALPVTHEPDGAMLLHHLSQDHPDQVGRYLDRMRHDEDIGRWQLRPIRSSWRHKRWRTRYIFLISLGAWSWALRELIMTQALHYRGP